jgi:hypothetical protein
VTLKQAPATVLGAISRRHRRAKASLPPLPERWDRQLVIAAPRASELAAGSHGTEAA